MSSFLRVAPFVLFAPDRAKLRTTPIDIMNSCSALTYGLYLSVTERFSQPFAVFTPGWVSHWYPSLIAKPKFSVIRLSNSNPPAAQIGYRTLPPLGCGR